MASEGELGRKWDRCMADSAVKLDGDRNSVTFPGMRVWCWIRIRNCFLSHLLQKKDMAYRFWVRDGVRNGLFQLST
ncbi:MICOS complex subunit MIC10 isoform 3-T4 [Alca torda]